MRLVLLGPPGAGKGTQGDLLSERLAVPKISTGDLLRRHAEAATPLGILARPHLDGGTLVPDEVTLGVVAERLRDPDTADGFLLDGFPRTLRQAYDIDKLLRDAGQTLDRVIEFRLPRADVVTRLSGRLTCVQCGRIWHLTFNPPPDDRCGDCGGALGQRADDQLATIERRLDVYAQQTVPLAEYYRDAGLLATVDATGPVDAVLAATMGVLRPVRAAAAGAGEQKTT